MAAVTKVLLLTHTLGLSGAPKIALDAVEQMGDAVEVRTLAIEGGPLEARCRALGALDFLHDPKYNRFPRRFRQPLGRRTLEASLREWKPDVIYANSIGSLDMSRTLRLPAAPALLHVHELGVAFDYYSETITPLVREWPQHYIAVSGPVRDLLTSRFAIDPAKISLVHEFVRDEDFQRPPPAPVRTDTRFVVGGAGTPNWRKGKSLWLETASELRALAGDDTFRFVWVGVRDDPDSIDFRNEVRHRKLEGVVELVPATQEPFPHFAGFDVFAMTSWEDPCPVVVLEAMMLKKPVLCFAGSGGAPEEVGDTGMVVENFSPAAMAQAIARLMAAPEQCRQLGEEARTRIGQQFTASEQAPKILRVLRQLAG